MDNFIAFCATSFSSLSLCIISNLESDMMIVDGLICFLTSYHNPSACLFLLSPGQPSSFSPTHGHYSLPSGPTAPPLLRISDIFIPREMRSKQKESVTALCRSDTRNLHLSRPPNQSTSTSDDRGRSSKFSLVSQHLSSSSGLPPVISLPSRLPRAIHTCSGQHAHHLLGPRPVHESAV